MTIRRGSDRLPSGVDTNPIRTHITINGSKISFHPVLPNERVVYDISREVSGADHLTLIIQPVCISVVSSESS